MSENFIAGMTLYFEQVNNHAGGREFHLHNRPIGFGPNSAVQTSRALIESDDVDLVTGIVDMALNSELRNLFHTQRLFLIANQVGANIIRPNNFSPFVINNSLNIQVSNLSSIFGCLSLRIIEIGWYSDNSFLNGATKV